MKVDFQPTVEDDWEYLIILDDVVARVDGNLVILTPVDGDEMRDEDGNLPDEQYYFLGVRIVEKDTGTYTSIIGWGARTIDEWYETLSTLPKLIKKGDVIKL